MTFEVIQQIQSIALDAYQSSGQAAALLKSGTADPAMLEKVLDQTASRMERSAVELRILCEHCLPTVPGFGQKPELPALDVAGQIETNEFGWLHIRLNTLLPNCRFASPLCLTDTITRLLDREERRKGKWPVLERALLVIEEHCGIASRRVFNQDNKGWKAVWLPTTTNSALASASSPSAAQSRRATSMYSLWTRPETSFSCALTRAQGDIRPPWVTMRVQIRVDLRLH